MKTLYYEAVNFFELNFYYKYSSFLDLLLFSESTFVLRRVEDVSYEKIMDIKL